MEGTIVESCGRGVRRVALLIVLATAGGFVYQLGRQHGYNHRSRELNTDLTQQSLDVARMRLERVVEQRAAGRARAARADAVN